MPLFCPDGPFLRPAWRARRAQSELEGEAVMHAAARQSDFGLLTKWQRPEVRVTSQPGEPVPKAYPKCCV